MESTTCTHGTGHCTYCCPQRREDERVAKLANAIASETYPRHRVKVSRLPELMRREYGVSTSLHSREFGLALRSLAPGPSDEMGIKVWWDRRYRAEVAGVVFT